MKTMYEVAIHERGKVMAGGGVNNPCEGLLFLKDRWTRITRRPVGLARAKSMADEQLGHAVVCEWHTATKVHDNGKAPTRPVGWWPDTATSAFDDRDGAASEPDHDVYAESLA